LLSINRKILSVVVLVIEDMILICFRKEKEKKKMHTGVGEIIMRIGKKN